MQLLKVLARVLEYPTEELQASKDALVAAVLEDSRLPRQNKEQLLRCVEMICDGDLLDMQENYVGMFDKGRATSLLLFEHVHGESRDRGQAMVDLMEEYRTNGSGTGWRTSTTSWACWASDCINGKASITW